MMSKNVPRRELAEAISVEQDADRYHPEQITLAVEGVDHLGALAVSGEQVSVIFKAGRYQLRPFLDDIGAWLWWAHTPGSSPDRPFHGGPFIRT